MCSATDLTARTRIRYAALELFGTEGINRVGMRAIAERAGVSAALIVHHFGSKEELRKACDAHVVAVIRGGGVGRPGDWSTWAEAVEAHAPERRYLARAFLDGSPAAAALFDEIVELTEAWLEGGATEGWVRATEQPRARAALYVTWLLAPLAFDTHLARVLGVDDVHDTTTLLRYAGPWLEMLRHGVFSDDRAFTAMATTREDGESR